MQFKPLTRLLFLTIAIVNITSCASTKGFTSVVDDVFGKPKYMSIKDTYISEESLSEYKERKDELTGSSSVISYTGENISFEETRDINLVKAPKLESYLQNIVDELIKKWPGTPIKAKINITAQSKFGPQADHLGNIYIPIGALSNVESKDELAMLIGHELSHLLLRHHERQEEFDEQRKLVTKIAGAVIVSNLAKDTDVVKVNDTFKLEYTASTRGKKNMVKAVLYNHLINSISDNVLSTAWGRVQEEEADLLSIDLAIAAQYSPAAASTALGRQDTIEKEKEKENQELREKQSQILKAAYDDGDLKGLASELTKKVSSLVGDASQWVKKTITRTHDSAEVRAGYADEYINREYLDEIGLYPGRFADWEDFKDTPEVSLIIEGYVTSNKALKALAQGELDKAEKLAIQSQNRFTKNHPEIREIMYQLRMEQNKVEKAEQNLFLVGDWNYASRSMFEKRISLHMKKNDFSEALRFIFIAEKNLYSSQPFSLQKAVALSNLGQKEKSVQALKDCTEVIEFKAQCQSILDSINSI